MHKKNALLVTVGYQTFALEPTPANIAAATTLLGAVQIDNRYIPGPGYKKAYVAKPDRGVRLTVEEIDMIAEEELEELTRKHKLDEELTSLRE